MTSYGRIVFGMAIAVMCVRALPAENPTRMWVIANHGLVLRALPSIRSARLDLAPYGAIVFLMNESKDDQVDKIKGKWQKVTYNGTIGWMFDGFLDAMIDKDANGAIFQRRIGRYQIIGEGVCKDGLFALQKYGALFYKNGFVGFVILSYDPAAIDDDTLVYFDASPSRSFGDSEDTVFMSGGGYTVLHKGAGSSLCRVLENCDSYFSSPKVVEGAIVYWAIDGGRIYAARKDLGSGLTKKTFLYDGETLATDYAFYFHQPVYRNGRFFFEKSGGTTFILAKDWHLERKRLPQESTAPN